MTKIVYNSCFGGFGLSPVAMKRYAELADLNYSETVYEGTMSKFFAGMQDKDGEYVSERDLPRTDPILIQVVEELGKKANTRFSDLRIIELAPGTKYRIDEYDGSESIMTVDDYEWSVA